MVYGMEYVVFMHFNGHTGRWLAELHHDGGTRLSATNRTLLTTLDTMREVLGAWLGDYEAADQAVLTPRFERLLGP